MYSSHAATLSSALPDLRFLWQVFYIGSVTYPLSLGLIKLALLFQYLRILDLGSRRRTACKYLIGITSAWSLVFCAAAWVPCLPVSTMWTFSGVANRRCWGFASSDMAAVVGFSISMSVSTTLLDLVILALPVKLFFQPNTQKKTRIALLCLLTLGLV